MAKVGVVSSLWRYPVKSMRGEELDEAVVCFGGIYGDRLFAFTSDARPAGFPWLTGREQRALLLYRPRFRYPDQALGPPNLSEAEAIDPGLNTVVGTPAALSVEVETPAGDVFAVDDPALADTLGQDRIGEVLTLVRSDRPLTDARPVSLFSLQTAAQLGNELGFELDKRRFRANIYLDLEDGEGFGEDAFVGRQLQIGPRVVVHVLERDPRCAMIAIDPDTSERNAAVLKQVADEHESRAGVYGAVLVEGTIRPGDEVQFVD